MNKILIRVPSDLKEHKLSNWQEFGSQFNPAHKSYILNKQITGCGATTYYLENNEPLILCSHRSLLLESKSNSPRHKGKVHLFKASTDSKVEELQNNMKRLDDYLDKCQGTPFSPARVPKILVTVDSLCHVYDVLQARGEIGMFTVVSDECQCLITDAPFKHESLLNYTLYLNGFNKVIFVSATPLEKYLAMFPDNYTPISQLPYYELQWPTDEICKPKLKVIEIKGSLSGQVISIINHYREYGYFEENTYCKATQAVFFLNSVKDIVKAISKTGLSPSEVNIICANTSKNRQRLRMINGSRYDIGTAPQEGEPHKTFTFVTKCSFEGTDFFHPNAYTYIFANPNMDNLLLDISSDVQQILGRQRLDSNPWKNCATMYTLPQRSDDCKTQEEFNAYVQRKDLSTSNKIREYEQADEVDKENKIEENKALKNGKIGYKRDYLEFVKDPDTNKVVPMPNFSVRICEQRAFDIRSGGFVENLYLYARNNKVCNSNPVLDGLERIMQSPGSFPYKMKLYIEYRQNYPEYKSDFLSSVFIETKYNDYYSKLGADKIKALSYQESNLKQAIQNDSYDRSQLLDALKNVFQKGGVYSNKDAKSMLQGVYDSVGIYKTAKATELNEWFVTSRSRAGGIDSLRIEDLR